MRSVISALIVTFVCGSLVAQQKPSLPQLGEYVEVSIVNLDVRVADKSGAHVLGLTSADFELFENGAAQTISNFSEFSAIPAGNRQGAEPSPGVATHEAKTMKIAAADVARARSSYHTFEFSVLVDDGTDKLSIGVLDEISRERGFAELKLPPMSGR